MIGSESWSVALALAVLSRAMGRESFAITGFHVQGPDRVDFEFRVDWLPGRIGLSISGDDMLPLDYRDTDDEQLAREVDVDDLAFCIVFLGMQEPFESSTLTAPDVNGIRWKNLD